MNEKEVIEKAVNDLSYMVVTRKLEEERKKTAKEILQRIYDNANLSWIDKNYIVNIGLTYGVEVEV